MGGDTGAGGDAEPGVFFGRHVAVVQGRVDDVWAAGKDCDLVGVSCSRGRWCGSVMRKNAKYETRLLGRRCVKESELLP